jgi:hypothetical protein
VRKEERGAEEIFWHKRGTSHVYDGDEKTDNGLACT